MDNSTSVISRDIYSQYDEEWVLGFHLYENLVEQVQIIKISHCKRWVEARNLRTGQITQYAVNLFRKAGFRCYQTIHNVRTFEDYVGDRHDNIKGMAVIDVEDLWYEHVYRRDLEYSRYGERV
jgi:hypothetical protein